MNPQGAIEMSPQDGEPLPPLQHPLDESILATMAEAAGAVGLKTFLEKVEDRRERDVPTALDSTSKRMAELCAQGVLAANTGEFKDVHRGPNFADLEATVTASARRVGQLVLIKHA